MVNSTKKSSKFIDAVDKNLQDIIIRLEQKLKGLLAEINVKLSAVSAEENPEIKKMLLSLSEETQKGISKIEHLTHLELEDDVNPAEFREKNHEQLEYLRQTFKKNMEELIKSKEEL